MKKFTIVCTCATAAMFALINSANSAPFNGAERLANGVLAYSEGQAVQVHARRHRHRHRHARRGYYGYGYSPYAYYAPRLYIPFGFGGFGHHGGHGFGHGGHHGHH